MKVLLTSPPIMDIDGGRRRPIAMDLLRECPPYGLYLLASALREAGHEVALADLIARGSCNVAPYAADLQDCDLVGIGATSLSWPTAVDVIGQIRKLRPELPIVLGAIHPTMFDRYLLRTFPVHFIIRGEAEVALPALCRALEMGEDLATVPGLSWVTPEGEVVRNRLGPLMTGAEIGAAPLPDYDLLPAGRYSGLSIESSRGCAHDCSFCSTSYRQRWRCLPAARFVDRLGAVMQYLGRTRRGTVHIIDDEFSTNPGRAAAIAREIRRRGLRPSLVFDSRAPDVLSDEYLESIREFTCQFLVGAECGYDAGLERIGKGLSCEVLERAARNVQRHGLSERADFSFILGLPWETRAEITETVRFAMHLFGTYGVRVLLQWYLQIPGSRLWEEDRRKQIVSAAMYNHYGLFRDLYLFRSGVQLTPSEIWDVMRMIGQLQWVAGLRFPGRPMIEAALPPPVADAFPEELLSDDEAGLGSLRQVAGRAGQAGPPRRHAAGYR